MNDLLLAVGGGGGQDPTEGDVELGSMPSSTDAFIGQVKDIKKQMQKIEELHIKLEKTNEYSKTVTKGAELKQCREQMHDDISKANNIARGVKRRIEQLQEESKKFEQGSAEERTRSNLTGTLMRNFKRLMDEFSKLRDRIQQEYREVVERRYYTINGKRAPEEDIERMIETGESETLFQKAILEQGRGRVLDTLTEIDERHKAVKELERSMLEMHQMFLDMAVLVEEQGAQLDNIENQVARAKSHVQRGAQQLEAARQSQKSTRRWAMMGIIIILVVVAIIVLALRPWNSGSNNNNNDG